jgi:hypothetical protein
LRLGVPVVLLFSQWRIALRVNLQCGATNRRRRPVFVFSRALQTFAR